MLGTTELPRKPNGCWPLHIRVELDRRGLVIVPDPDRSGWCIAWKLDLSNPQQEPASAEIVRASGDPEQWFAQGHLRGFLGIIKDLLWRSSLAQPTAGKETDADG